MVGFGGCPKAFGFDAAFTNPWSAQKGQGKVVEKDPILSGVDQLDLRGIIAEYYVQRPVQAILHAPE
jgi:hypothetical protein